MSKFYFCSCFLTHNIYIKRYKAHFNYINRKQFFKDYGVLLKSLGCDTDWKQAHLLEEINIEVDRRKQLEKQALERKEQIRKNFNLLEESLNTPQESYFHPKFLMIVNAAKGLNNKLVFSLLDVISKEKQVYGFPVFTEDFCQKLVKEILHYQNSSLPKGQPNSMNRFGVLLDEIGLHNFSEILRTEYLDALSAVMFPEWRGKGLDSHKIFTVNYKINEDVELGYHYDNSEVTLNVCLNTNFSGGEIYFGDQNTIPIADSSCILIQHKVGYGILHTGQQLHGALPITAGERNNLIFWMRASSVRNRMCPMCKSKPKLLPAQGYGDGFTLSS